MPVHFYWEQIINTTPEIPEQFEDTFQKLKEGRHSGLHLEKLRNHDIYNVRVNDSNRSGGIGLGVHEQSYLSSG